MPKVPGSLDLARANTGALRPVDIVVPAGAFDSGAGRALSRVGASLGAIGEARERKVAEAAAKQQRLDDAEFLTDRATKLHRAMTLELERMEREEDPTEFIFVENLETFANETIEDLFGPTPDGPQPSEEALQQGRLRAQAATEGFIAAAIAGHGEARRAKTLGVIVERINQIAVETRDNPEGLEPALAAARMEIEQYRGTELNDAAIDALIRDNERTIVSAAIDGAIARNDAEAAQAILAEESRGGLFTGAQRGALETRIEVATARADAEQQAAKRAAQVTTQRLMTDNLVSLRATGKSDIVDRNTIVANFGEAAADEYESQEIRALELFKTVELLQDATPEERAQLLVEALPHGDGFLEEAQDYHELLNINARIELEVNDDPAAFVRRRSATVAAAFDRAAADPDNHGAWREAVALSIAEQERRGVPPDRARILTNMEAETVNAKLLDAKGQARTAEIHRLVDLSGKAWPRLFGELVDAGMPEDVRALAGVRRDRPLVQHNLSLALDTPITDFRRDLPNEADKLIEEVGETLAPLFATLSDQPGALAERDFHRRTVTRLAFHYVAEGKEGVTGAVERAANEVIFEHYWFEDEVRIPKEHAVDEDQVKAITEALDKVLQEIGVFAIDVRDDPDLPPDVARHLFVDTLKANGRWLTDRTEDGVILQDQFGSTVMIDGEPFTVSFATLKDLLRRLRPVDNVSQEELDLLKSENPSAFRALAGYRKELEDHKEQLRLVPTEEPKSPTPPAAVLKALGRVSSITDIIDLPLVGEGGTERRFSTSPSPDEAIERGEIRRQGLGG